ncbi:Kei1p [Rhodotorula paludigena]|uniref:Kei1p n=1 Tax=Rhodotorula paludigena TaxID=86838 RepID=UPI003173DDA3
MAIRLRAQPLLDSFAGMDLKLGATLISLFALLNKVAGAYGMLAVLLSGGAALSQPWGQLTMYIYSIVSLVGFIWGLQKISEENGPKTLYYAHLFAADHLIGTVYTAFFAVVWYMFVPHDGRRVANSDAQKAMMGGSQSGDGMDEAARTAAAMGVWKSERGFSATVLAIGWLLKIYFILVLYSYALHVRRGTYSSLPKSSHNTIPSSKFTSNASGSSPSSRHRRRFSPTHTRDSSTGGPRYTHLRGNSLASTAGIGGNGRTSLDGLDGTETTLAETLWEETDTMLAEEEIAMRAQHERTRRASSRSPLPRVSGAGAGAVGPAAGEPMSPAFAKGTGIARTPSGGVLVKAEGAGAAAQEGAQAAEEHDAANPFAKILGRMSTEAPR